MTADTICQKPLSKIWWLNSVSRTSAKNLTAFSQATTDQCGITDLKCGITNYLTKFKSLSHVKCEILILMEAKSTLRRGQTEVSCWRNRPQTSSVAFQKVEGSCPHAFVTGMYSLLLNLWSRNVTEMAIWSHASCHCSLVWTKSSVSEPLSQTLKALSHLYLTDGGGEWKMPWDSVWCCTL